MAMTRACATLGCQHPAPCPVHHYQRLRRYDQQRGTAASRGYTNRWDKARRLYLARFPLCVACRAEGHLTAASVVDHIVPHRGDQALFWDEANWQSLCPPHHSAKTLRGE